jgi:gliding motility-associated-like protein
MGQSILFNGINQSSSGIFKDTLMNYAGCDSIITLNLQVNNTSSFQNNIVICSDQQYVLANGQVVSAAGNYIDTIANYVNCDSIITTHLEVIQKPLVYLGNDTAICDLKSIELVAPNYINAQYIWNDLSNQTTLSASNAGLYSVSIVVPPCNAVRDTIQISHIDCSCLLEMPNVFTPNGDGLNDQIKPVIFCDAPIDHYEWMIFNRWGELVFKSTNIAESWNGIYKNQTQNEQTFVYIIRYTNPITFNEIKLKGDFILLR